MKWVFTCILKNKIRQNKNRPSVGGINFQAGTDLSLLFWLPSRHSLTEPRLVGPMSLGANTLCQKASSPSPNSTTSLDPKGLTTLAKV